MQDKMEKKSLKVMLIDDNIIDLKINSKIIQLSGLFDEIIQYQSAEEALNYFNHYRSEPEKLPDLILLDIQMPEMDGFEFLEKYKSFPTPATEKSLIAMLSSTLDFGDIKKAEANSYVIKLLKKPLSTLELQKIFKSNFR
jgi:CheY-like chemotaxis protein